MCLSFFCSGTQENTTADMREETSFSLAYESGPDDEDRLDDVNSKRTYREHDKIQYDEGFLFFF